MAASMPTIQLNPNEQKLATLLVECADWVDEHPEEVDKLRLKDEEGKWIGGLRGSEKVELRIAGGWVRDKVSSGFTEQLAGGYFSAFTRRWHWSRVGSHTNPLLVA